MSLPAVTAAQIARSKAGAFHLRLWEAFGKGEVIYRPVTEHDIATRAAWKGQSEWHKFWKYRGYRVRTKLTEDRRALTVWLEPLLAVAEPEPPPRPRPVPRYPVEKICPICRETFVVTRSKAQERVTCGKRACDMENRSNVALGRPCSPQAIAARKAWAKRRVETMTRQTFGDLSERDVKLFNYAYRHGYAAGLKRATTHRPAHLSIEKRAWAQPQGRTA